MLIRQVRRGQSGEGKRQSILFQEEETACVNTESLTELVSFGFLPIIQHSRSKALPNFQNAVSRIFFIRSLQTCEGGRTHYAHLMNESVGKGLRFMTSLRSQDQ